MKEFREAHAHATGNGRNKFLIPILFGDVGIGDLDADLKFYLEKSYVHTVQQLGKSSFFVTKKLVCGMTFFVNFLQNEINFSFPWI